MNINLNGDNKIEFHIRSTFALMKILVNIHLISHIFPYLFLIFNACEINEYSEYFHYLCEQHTCGKC